MMTRILTFIGTFVLIACTIMGLRRILSKYQANSTSIAEWIITSILAGAVVTCWILDKCGIA